MPPTPERRRVPWEQHFQSIAITFIVAAVFFAIAYFYNDNKEKGQNEFRIKFVTDQVIDMRSDIRALQNSYARREEVEKLEERLRSVERRVR